MIKIPRRKRFIAAGILAAMQAALAASAFAQNVNVSLNPAEVVAIVRSMERLPISEVPPAAYWDTQIKIIQALEANPDAWREVKSALGKRYPVR
jgi:hypothetical protein